MTAPAAPDTARVAEPSARFRDLLAAEWIKLWSLRSTYGALGVMIGAAAFFSVYAARADQRNWASYPAERRALFNPLRDAFPEQAYLFVMLAAASLGAVTIVGEYGTGLIRTTFTAVPARGAVAAAKIVVVAGVLSVAGAVAAATSFGLSQALLASVQADVGLGEPDVPRAIIASALLAPVCALAGMGLGALIRHTAPTIVTAAVILLLLPSAVDPEPAWEAAIRHSLPVFAWQRLIQLGPDPYYVGDESSIGRAWATYAAWALVGAVLTVLLVRRRDPS